MTKRLWCDKDEALRNVEDVMCREVPRVHPSDRPDLFRELAKKCEAWATGNEKFNETNGVPERG